MNKFSSEELDREADVILLQINRGNKTAYLRLGAVIVLLFIGVGFLAYVTTIVPSMVITEYQK